MKMETIKRRWLLGLLVGLMMMVGAAPAMAWNYIPIGGIYGPNANDSVIELQSVLGSIVNDYCFTTDCLDNLALLAKIEIDDPEESTGAFLDDFSITPASGGHTGTWSSEEAAPLFVVVKASTYYKIYYAEFCELGTSGNWDTSGIINGGNNQPDLSHISFYGCSDGGGGQNVPIPGAVWLLGSGLSALLVARRRRK